MPWRETWAMDERMRFVLAASEDEAVMSEVCAEFGISRQTGYKWLGRYRAEGALGLRERSRAPLQHGRAHPDELVEAVLSLRERHPTWGPKKLRRKLGDRSPAHARLALSTIGDWLRKEGVTAPRAAGGVARPMPRRSSRRTRRTRYGAPTSKAGSPPATAAAAIR